MPATIDAAALCKMAERGQITGGLLDGPLAFDNAISKEAARDQGHQVGGRRRSRHPARARPRSGQHPRQAAHVPGQRRQRRARAGARVPIILTSRADSVRSRIASCAVAMLAAHARRQQQPRCSEADVMDDYALVLNAGSSSLKFCVFQRPAGEAWRLEARGQIEGIGTAPRFSRQGRRRRRARRRDSSTQRCTTAARRSSARRVAAHRSYGGARVLGVGHRVVHGGAALRGPDDRRRRRCSTSCER